MVWEGLRFVIVALPGLFSYLFFWIGTILAIFDLQVTLILPTKFRVIWPFGSGEEAQNRFSRWPLWWPSWSFESVGISVQEKFKKRFLRRRP